MKSDPGLSENKIRFVAAMNLFKILNSRLNGLCVKSIIEDDFIYIK